MLYVLKTKSLFFQLHSQHHAFVVLEQCCECCDCCAVTCCCGGYLLHKAEHLVGVEYDADVNEKTFGRNGVTELSTKNSKVKVYMIPTNEELVIASDTEEIVKNSK